MTWNWRKWLDGFALAAQGILLATKGKRFWIGFVISFLFFGTLMNLLSGGTAKFQLMWASGFFGVLKIIAGSLLATFGVNQFFLDWLPIFAIALLQSLLIGLIVLLWRQKQQQNSQNVQKAGLITGLIALGAGCPTCGTTLITPLIGTFASTSSLTIASNISSVVTALAIIIAVLSLKRLGEETYIYLAAAKFENHRKESTK